MKKLLYIDVETTGLVKYTHGIIQIAYIIEINSNVVKRGSFKINPYSYKKPRKVEAKALEINGFKEEDFSTFMDAKEAAIEFYNILNNYVDRFNKADYFTFVGFNSTFDTGFVQEWLNETTSSSYWQFISYKDLDVFALVKYLVYTGLLDTGPSQNLENSCKAIGLEFNAHDAIGDIEATRDLHLRLCKEFLV